MVESSQPSGETPKQRGLGGRPAEGGLLALGQALRTFLRFHQQSGIERYPASAAVLRSQATARRSPSSPATTRDRCAPASAAVTDHQSPPEPSPPVPEATLAPPSAILTWQEVHHRIRTCQLCPLGSDRQGQVPGRGNMAAPLLVVGDYGSQTETFAQDCLFGPEEDRMLANMMLAIDCQPDSVYVTNVIKCCPQAGVVPAEVCSSRCQVHLQAEVALVRPRVILAMGEMAMAALLGGGDSVVLRRGRFHSYRPEGSAGTAIPVMVTFHPRWLLANPDLKRATWQDLQTVQRQLRTT